MNFVWVHFLAGNNISFCIWYFFETHFSLALFICSLNLSDKVSDGLQKLGMRCDEIMSLCYFALQYFYVIYSKMCIHVSLWSNFCFIKSHHKKLRWVSLSTKRRIFPLVEVRLLRLFKKGQLFFISNALYFDYVFQLRNLVGFESILCFHFKIVHISTHSSKFCFSTSKSHSLSEGKTVEVNMHL